MRTPKQRIRAAELIRKELASGPKRSGDIRHIAAQQHIGGRTLGLAALELGLSVSNGSIYRTKEGWYWQLPIRKES